MRLVQVHEFGDVDVLRIGEADRPEPAEGQVLVEVEVASVSYPDTLARRGSVPWPLPYRPGIEIAGTVVQAADEHLLGKRVVARTAGFQGGFADFALADTVYEVPDDLSTEDALVLFGGGEVTFALLDKMQVSATDTVLVTAAAGRTGSFLVQAAQALGARVTGVTSRSKLAAVKEFGAEAVAYDDDEGWGEPTVVLDSVGGEAGERAIGVAKDRVMLYGFASGTWPKIDGAIIGERGLTVVGAAALLRRTPQQQQAHVTRALTSGLTAKIHAIHPLDRIGDAYTDLEQRRNIGAVLLRLK